MKHTFSALLICTAVLIIPAALAHHRWPVNMNVPVTVQGTVMDYDWRNPHPMITIEVINDDGTMEEWEIGGPATTRMEARGWNADTVKPGDMITGTGYQFLDGSKIIRLERVTLADGRELLVYARE